MGLRNLRALGSLPGPRARRRAVAVSPPGPRICIGSWGMPNRHFAIVFAAACLSTATGILAATLPAKADDGVAAKAQVCSTCHGQSGTPISATFPIIWGQQQNYLYKELHDYHSGDRAN